MLIAPGFALAEGISVGAFEYVLQGPYSGITIICGFIVIGMFAGLLAVYWLGFADTDSTFALYAAGGIGGLVFVYAAPLIMASFGITVPFLHAAPADWNLSVLALFVVGCGTLVKTFREIQTAIEAGAPKWVEWRAAICLFASFVILLKLLRHLVLRRSMGRLVWEALERSIPKQR
jgi:uncharacterized YccA/Bax inhibitor family protein